MKKYQFLFLFPNKNIWIFKSFNYPINPYLNNQILFLPICIKGPIYVDYLSVFITCFFCPFRPWNCGVSWLDCPFLSTLKDYPGILTNGLYSLLNCSRGGLFVCNLSLMGWNLVGTLNFSSWFVKYEAMSWFCLSGMKFLFLSIRTCIFWFFVKVSSFIYPLRVEFLKCLL